MFVPIAYPLKRSNSKQQSCATTATQSTSLSRGTLSSSSSTSTSTVALRNLIYLQEWTDVISVCISNPYEAKATDRTGDLPLHEACLHGAPIDVIKCLLSAYPYGVREKGFCDRLPLHYAVYNKPSLDTIHLLLRKFPEAISTADVDGYLPIHLAVIRSAPKQFIEALIMAYPKSLRITNKFGNTPQMLAKNDIIYSILSERETVSQKISAKKKATKNCNVSNACTAKNELQSNTSCQTLRQSRRVMNASNMGVTTDSPQSRKGRQVGEDNMKGGECEKKIPSSNKFQVFPLVSKKKTIDKSHSVSPLRRSRRNIDTNHSVSPLRRSQRNIDTSRSVSPACRSQRNIRVYSRLPFNGKNVSRLIQKHESHSEERDMNGKKVSRRTQKHESNSEERDRSRIRRRNLVISTVVVT